MRQYMFYTFYFLLCCVLSGALIAQESEEALPFEQQNEDSDEDVEVPQEEPVKPIAKAAKAVSPGSKASLHKEQTATQEDALRQEVESLKKSLESMKKELVLVKKNQPQGEAQKEGKPPSVKKQAAPSSKPKESKDAIADLIPMEEDDSGSSNPEEQKAMAEARAHATKGTLEVDDVHGCYNELCGLYNDAMLSEGQVFKTKVKQFKIACAEFIDQNQTHSFSRSTVFYLGNILLKNGEYKDAQQAFAAAYKGDESGPHAPDALLGMAEVQVHTGQASMASGILNKIQKDFPAPSLTEETKERFKRVAKLAKSNISLTPVIAKKEMSASKAKTSASKPQTSNKARSS